MNESDWLTATDAAEMLRHLGGKISNRKWRLFGCACCRHGWAYLTDPRSRQAVEVAERFADGLAGQEELQSAQKAACSAYPSYPFGSDGWNTAHAVAWAAQPGAGRPGDLYVALASPGRSDPVVYAVSHNPALRQHADLLREVVGNPFRTNRIDPAWLTHDDGAVRKVAQAIYDQGKWDDLPILADALEDAGCTSADILEHCLRPGGHVRGCWVVDALLGLPLPAVDIDDLMTRFARLSPAAQIGRGPAHPSEPDADLVERLERWLEQHPFLRREPTYIAFLQRYAGAVVDDPEQDLAIDLHGFAGMGCDLDDDSDGGPLNEEAPGVDGRGFYQFALVRMHTLPDHSFRSSVLMGFSFDASQQRQPGVYRGISTPNGPSIEPHWFCASFSEWLERAIQEKGRLL